MESAGKDVSQGIFSVFHNRIFFSCFGLWPSFLGNPETQTVSHSFPKLCAALQRTFGTDAAYRADVPLRVRLSESRRISLPMELSWVVLWRYDAGC
jgi:hypothetical protein